MKRTLLLSLLSAAIMIASALAAVEPGLEVSIAVPKNEIGERVLKYSWTGTPRFYVVVTNTSDQAQRIWHEGSSWGYDALAFEVTDRRGKTWTAKKKSRSWDKNTPGYRTLEPHDCWVIEVEFAADVWEGFPRPAGYSQTFKMRAVFQTSEDEWSRKDAVWTGRAVSKTDDYTFYQ